MSKNTPPAGYRFGSKVFKADSKKIKEAFKAKEIEPWMLKKRVCGICGQEYSGYVKIKSTRKGLACTHERPALCEDPHLTAGEQKRIGGRLAPNEVAVKGDDGLIRIVEK